MDQNIEKQLEIWATAAMKKIQDEKKYDTSLFKNIGESAKLRETFYLMNEHGNANLLIEDLNLGVRLQYSKDIHRVADATEKQNEYLERIAVALEKNTNK